MRRDLQAWAMLAHGASLAERRVIPSSNEKIINLVRPERGHVRHGVLFRLRMCVERVQARTLILHVIPKQERAGTIGDGVKPGYPSLMGLGGANVQLGTKHVPNWTFLPRPHLSRSFFEKHIRWG